MNEPTINPSSIPQGKFAPNTLVMAYPVLR